MYSKTIWHGNDTTGVMYGEHKHVCLKRTESSWRIVFFKKNAKPLINNITKKFDYPIGYEKSIEIVIDENPFPNTNVVEDKDIWLSHPNRIVPEDGWFDHHSLFWHISLHEKEFPKVSKIILPVYDADTQYEWKTSLWNIMMSNYENIPFIIDSKELSKYYKSDNDMLCFDKLYQAGRMMVQEEGGYIYNFEEGAKLRELAMSFYDIEYNTTAPEKLNTVIVQEAVTSKFINYDALIRITNTLQVFEIYPIHTFNNESLETQIKAFVNADIVYIPHNLPYPGLLFMSNNSFVIEALPYLFHGGKTTIPTILLNLGYAVNFSTKKPNATYVPPPCPFEFSQNPVCEYERYNMDLWINMDYADFSYRQALAYLEFNKYQKFDWPICGDYQIDCNWNATDFRESGIIFGEPLTDD